MTGQTTNRYLAVPPAGKGPGVLVLHAWWGLNDFIRSFCDRLAQQGFVALAPDLYFGKLARTIEEAEQLAHSMDEDRAGQEILSSAEELGGLQATSGNGLGVIGFSLGASYALWLSQERPQAVRSVVLFYGTGEGDFSKAQAAYQGHFAEQDPYEDKNWVHTVEQDLIHNGHPTQFYTYPGTGHWFFESDRPEAYNAAAAQLAWQRTLAFLHEQLGEPGD